MAHSKTRKTRIFSVIALLGASLGITVPTVVRADTGCPTAVAPTQVGGIFEVDTRAKLQWVKDSGTLSNSFALTANIDMSGCSWSNGIGSVGSPFSGTWEGNSHTVSNLTIAAGSTSDVGLFGVVTGIVRNMTLASPSVTTTGSKVGSIAGVVTATGSLSSISVTSVTISGNNTVGGIIGQTSNGSTVTGVSVSGSVTGTGMSIGGVMGINQGSVAGATNTATVTGQSTVGGIAGTMYSTGTILSSSSTGNVSDSGSGVVGGAVGEVFGTAPTCGTLTSVTTSGNISGANNVGGLIGYGNCYYIIRSSSSATVTSSSSFAGGLVANENASGEIDKSFFTGTVQATEAVGGIAGASRSVISDSFSSGSVTATLGTNGGRAGGLVGWSLGGTTITRSMAVGTVTPPASSSSTTGGLIGQYSSGTITNSVWDTTASGRATSGGSGAVGYTTQQLRDYVLFNSDNLNWNITNGISQGTTWSICSGANSGYPFLSWRNLTGTCLPTMAYNANGNTGGVAPLDPSTPYANGATVTVADNTGTMTKTGNVFIGWNTKADGTGTSVTVGSTFTISAPVMLFAMWSSTPTLQYRLNEGAGTLAPVSASTGTSVTLATATGLSRSGFILSRWDTSSMGTGTSYALGESITMPANGLTLWAVWTVDPSATTTTTTTAPPSSPTTAPSNTPSSNSTVPSSGTPVNSPSAPSGGTTRTTIAQQATATPSVGTTTIAPSTTTTTIATTTDVPDIESVKTNEAGATVGGKPVDVEVTNENGTVVVTVGKASIRYSITDNEGVRRLISDTSNSVQVAVGDTVTIEMSGLASNVDASAWLVPGDFALGSVQLSQGKGTISGVISQDATAGLSRIVTASQSQEAEPFVVAYGVEIVDSSNTGTNWSLVFLFALGLAVISAFIIPAVRRRKDEE